ncbi:hypothetical protein ILYODFUR_001649 [Ilyodon furcidens]|uniref:Secreted protein n=1 Tax=Ilyodon furcidens TaxID=33524 RepID=A0ABV0V142_9TELE
MERGARACVTQTLPLFVCVCGSRRGRCTRLIVGHFKLYCHVCQLVHLSRHVDSVPKSQITKKKSLQNTPATCSHNAAPFLAEKTFQPARQSVSSVLQSATDFAEHDQPSI